MRQLFTVVLLLACVGPWPANAVELYRCISHNGQISYQSNFCTAGQRLDRVLTYQPEPDARPSNAQAITHSSHAKHVSRPHSSPTYRRRTTALTRSDRCRRAKQQRETKLEQLGLRRTYEQLSRLDAKVRASCRW